LVIAIEHMRDSRPTLDEEKARGLFREAIARKVASQSRSIQKRRTAANGAGPHSLLEDRLV
jgi:hypothetical protein